MSVNKQTERFSKRFKQIINTLEVSSNLARQIDTSLFEAIEKDLKFINAVVSELDAGFLSFERPPHA